MSKRKVLFLIESLAGGGAEKVLTTLVQHIDKVKFDVTVCAISGGGKYESVVRKNVKYHAILNEPVNSTFFNGLLYKLKHHLIYHWLPMSWVYQLFVPQGNDVEVAYIEGFTTKLLSHSSNIRARKHAWLHIDLFQNHWTKSVYRNMREETDVYHRFDTIWGVSYTVQQAFMKEFPNVHTPVGIIYNPINSKQIRNMATDEIDTKHKHPLLVTVGRLEHQKGYDRLVKICKNLLGNGYEFELWIIGAGSQGNQLKQYIQENNLMATVKLLGLQDNPYKYMAQGDLFVCSSRSEGYSTAVTEALILGLPVITTDCSGMAELLKNGECGMITENDDQALYEGLKRVLDDTALLEDYRKKAVERGKDFAIESLMEPIENLLME